MSKLTVDLCLELLFNANDVSDIEEAELFIDAAYECGSISILQRNALLTVADECYYTLTRSATTP